MIIVTGITGNTELNLWQWSYYNENNVREIDGYGSPIIFMKTLVPCDQSYVIYKIFEKCRVQDARFLKKNSEETKIFIPLEEYEKFHGVIISIFEKAISPGKVKSQLRIFEECDFNPKKFPSATSLHMSQEEWVAFFLNARNESQGTPLIKEEKERKKKEQEWRSKFDDDGWNPFWNDIEYEIKRERIWPLLMKEIQQRNTSH